MPRKKPEPPQDIEADKRAFVEAALEGADFYRKNRIYAFREAKPHEVAMEVVAGEKFFTPPNPPQKRMLDAWGDRSKKVFVFSAANRVGKTHLGCIIGISVMLGRWPWNNEPIEFPHKRFRKVRWVGQAWESHVKTVLVKKLEDLWPKNRPVETKKNNQGVDAVWKDRLTGSTLEIMSNVQDSDVFEGWDGDLVIYDEPPRREVRVACARGLVDREGREFFCATLLKEAWLHREVIKARLENGAPDPSVFNVTGDIFDNLGFGLTQAGIDQFAKALKPEEREARIYGKPSYLSTLVYPRFNRDLHVKAPFKIPLDWIVDVSLDFHPSKPWAIVFMATSRTGFKYVCHEIELRGNPKYVGEEIVRWVKTNNIRIGRCVIDPLAKGDENNDQTVFAILEDTLGAYGIGLDVASKDKDNGIAMVNNLLWTENEMPGLYFFTDCPKTIQQVEDLMYDPDTLKPTAVKVDDDFTECLYRLALLDTQWFPEHNYNVSEQRSVLL